MSDDSNSPLPLGHHEMLVEGLRSIFGEFNADMLNKVLPRVEWVELAGGEVLFRQGERDESIYFVISGRLRATSVDSSGAPTVVGEMARGETVGEMAFFTKEARTATITALRDTVLAHFSPSVFRELLVSYPLISINMTRLVIERLKRASGPRKKMARSASIGIAAITSGVDHIEFAADRLARTLERHGKTTVLTADGLDALLGDAGAAQAPVNDSLRSRRVAQALERIEADNRIVLLIADSTPTGWTKRCLRHCDEVLLVADADQSFGLSSIEIECLGAQADSSRQPADLPSTQINRTLVLLHPDARVSPVNTARWLKSRQLNRHIHVRRGLDSDWQRLGRLISGNAVGLVLAGGGARGFAHLGVLKALQESGLGYDLVAGTSMGAVMGAFAAMDLPVEELVAGAKDAFSNNPTGDFNVIPLISLISGRRLRAALDKAIIASRGQHIDVEDLWKGYFCVSSNYSTATEAVLSRGPLAKSIRASVSIPGALPPVMLNGELHIDGGSFNNFPTDVMSRMGAARIIGVNLVRERNLRYEFDEVPGSFALLRDKLRGHDSRLPSLTGLLVSASMMHSYARQKEAQQLVDLYFSPPVQDFGILEWRAFDRIVEIGYQHGKKILEKIDPTLACALK